LIPSFGSRAGQGLSGGSCSGPRCVGGEGFRVNSARTLMGAIQRGDRSKDSAGGTGD